MSRTAPWSKYRKGHLAIMNRMKLSAFIGIDYSGAETSTRRLKALQGVVTNSRVVNVNSG